MTERLPVRRLCLCLVVNGGPCGERRKQLAGASRARGCCCRGLYGTGPGEGAACLPVNGQHVPWMPCNRGANLRQQRLRTTLYVTCVLPYRVYSTVPVITVCSCEVLHVHPAGTSAQSSAVRICTQLHLNNVDASLARSYVGVGPGCGREN